jgi:hypothetical protein
MSASVPQRKGWPEEAILEALEMRDHDGMTYGQIARRIGRTRNAVIATLRHVDAQADKHDPTGCRNGTMPRGWWRR